MQVISYLTGELLVTFHLLTGAAEVCCTVLQVYFILYLTGELLVPSYLSGEVLHLHRAGDLAAGAVSISIFL